MKQGTDFMTAMADFDQDPDAVIWRAGSPVSLKKVGSGITLHIPFSPFKLESGLTPSKTLVPEMHTVTLELWGDSVLRLTTNPGKLASPMIDLASEMKRAELSVQEEADKWIISDETETIRACFLKKSEPAAGWSDLIRPSFDSLAGYLVPETTPVQLSSHDQFFPEKVESLPLAFVDYCLGSVSEADTGKSKKRSYLFSFSASHDEHFAGTGERFDGIDLRGKTLILENTDGLGVNSRRAYKNIPFYLSNKGYGLFMHTSCHVRLSFADISTRAVQGRIDEDSIDLFIIGGSGPEGILYNYRCITGFPPKLPIWSYGVWMSRMTYFSADEILGIADRMRLEKYPCDVLHIDTGWFTKDWVCEWEFSSERFPDPSGFMKELKNQGYRVSLWQTPNIGEGNKLLSEALSKRYLAPPKKGSTVESSDFSGQDFGGQIDFTNPDAEQWYREKIRSLLEMGAAAIKTDFGEKIQQDADYLHMSVEELHNLYALLYQRAAFEETEQTTQEGIIWARAGWTGCQRYPVHWGGDAASSWDGMAATLRGGLQLGLSGFGFWSHDVPGFHGIPEFMNTLPSDSLYMRWTQMGVFTSHLRYHGTSVREPWYYPEISFGIRKWFNLRYALIPYFLEQEELITQSGFPMLRAMLLQYPNDPVSWYIDDQYFCGENFLVCPVMNDSGVRNIYLPDGEWVDFWTGESHSGSQWLMQKVSTMDQLPVFCPAGSSIPVYPDPVQCTDEIDLTKVVKLVIDSDFTGISEKLEKIELP